MDGRDVRLHLRNQEHIERELKRIADALETIVKMSERNFTNETEDKNNEGNN